MSMSTTINKHEARDRATVKALDSLIEHIRTDSGTEPQGLTAEQVNGFLTEADAIKAKVAAPVEKE